jgi:hypothetical protein
MPRAKQVPESPAKKQATHDIWQMYGYQPPATLPDFDIDYELVWMLISAALLDGQMVNFKQGDGGQSLGIQIWTWDDKRPYMWFGEGAEFDSWAKEMLARIKREREEKQKE